MASIVNTNLTADKSKWAVLLWMALEFALSPANFLLLKWTAVGKFSTLYSTFLCYMVVSWCTLCSSIMSRLVFVCYAYNNI